MLQYKILHMTSDELADLVLSLSLAGSFEQRQDTNKQRERDG